jgi:hypothetical protein
MLPIKELDCTTIDHQDFEHEVLINKTPLVLRSIVKHWPLVQESQKGISNAVDYVTKLDSHKPCYTVVAPPSAKGRLFYSDNLAGVNFQRINAALTATLEQLLVISNASEPHAVSVQAALIKDCLPGFTEGHPLALLADSVEPTLWLSNRSRVAAHYDLNDNIACVTTGRRRFTVFPPDQVSNLYVGPTLNSPGGVPTSLVDIQNPDFERFPNFKFALDNGFEAELEPGDAIFIPSPWWHSVESLESINILVNYWWNSHLRDDGPTANNSLMMAMLTISDMDQAQRNSWKDLFEYFVFKSSGDPAAHLPETLQDLATGLGDEQRQQCMTFLAEACLKK